jgi:GNAT superfamily N-acetyltransferase
VDFGEIMNKYKLHKIIKEVLSEEKVKRDRCLRIADRKFDKPSAYKSGAVVRCRKGDIWKDLKEELLQDISFKLYNITDNEYKVAAELSGNIIGTLYFIKSKYKPVLKATSVSVTPLFRRKGIGSKMYQFAEKELGNRFIKSDEVLTSDGKELWSDPNRKFGLNDLKETNFLLERKYKSTKWIIDILESIKGDLIGKDYGNLEIENILNKAFSKYRINFERGFNETTRDNWGEVGIIEGYIYENGNIYIVYDDNFYLTFEDDYLWDNFKKVCTSILSHELTHRDQFIKILKNQNYVKPVSRITNSSYLSDDKEIQAFAREALEEYIQLGYNKNQILQLIKTPTGSNKDQASKEESDSFWYYYDYFSDSQYGNPKVWKKFLKYMYQYLSTWNENAITEDESLHKWFKRSGSPGKEGGWVDCNAPIRKDGKITGYKPCGRKEGEKRAKYPSCRPTAAKCKDKGKGKTWGKTK